MKCSNCEIQFTSQFGFLEVTLDGSSIARICAKCQETVLVAKIVLQRGNTGEQLRFEQYLPVACSKV